MSLLQSLLAILTGGGQDGGARKAPTGPAPAPPPPPAPSPAPSSNNPRIFERRGDPLVALDDQLEADIRVSLVDCRSLVSLPSGLRTGSLDLSGCTAIEALPAGLDVAFLDLAGCGALKALPADLRLRGGRLNVRDCTKLSALPAGMGSVAQLDLRGCTNIRALPDDLEVTSWIDIGGSGIDRLPARFAHLSIRRHGEAVAASEIF
ncbi:hypothetical protein [Sphingomonas colocasiae]|uniref:Leucine-rich repeat domain-containing protein n=1 Tax=Sphingomonas colocasiae TaxID=1848973 RepID=A0ABS7PUT1_9SPHN|nr:hypothetical protein [Sphingomonas colocasiae]MBY8825132.1 hypothetical protein [Sphingomonas colocasiae]